jgi:hypothetical protein
LALVPKAQTAEEISTQFLQVEKLHADGKEYNKPVSSNRCSNRFNGFHTCTQYVWLGGLAVRKGKASRNCEW